VAGGASVSFLAGLSAARASAFWRDVAASVTRGERVVLAAFAPGMHRLVGTVQVVLAQPENQPHRGDVAKMLVHPAARRQGVGAQLLAAAEQAARAAGKTLLVLDTASGSDAERLYERQGWVRVGEIPGYALGPEGRLGGTVVFYKALGG